MHEIPIPGGVLRPRGEAAAFAAEAENLGFLWNEYALEDDSLLTGDAIELKRQLLAAFEFQPSESRDA